MNLNFWKKDNDANEPADSHKPEVEYPSLKEENLAPVIDYQVEPPDLTKALFYNNISRWALYVGVFLVPLFFLPLTSNVLEINKQLLLIIVAGVGLIAWLLGVVSSGYLAWRPNFLDKGILALVAAFALGTIFSPAPFKSLFGLSFSLSNSLVSILALTILYFLVVNNVDDKGRMLRSLLGGSIVLVLLYGLLQLFGVHILRFSFAVSRAFNTVGSVNTLGIISAISLPFFYKSHFDLDWVRKIHLNKIGLVLSLAVLVVLNWWVFWVIAIAGMVAMIIFENISGSRFRMTKLILPMTVVILGVFLMIVNIGLGAIRNNLPVEVAPSFRLSADIGIATLRNKPVFGFGSENFSLAFDRYGAGTLANSTLSNVKFFDAASEIMTLAVQGGLIMLAALVFFFWCLAVVVLRFRRHVMDNQDPESIKENVGVLASLTAMAAGLFLYPFNLTLMTFFYLFMGMVVLFLFDKNRKEFNIEEKASLSLSSSLGFIGGLIMVLVGVYFGVTAYLSDVRYTEALASSNNDEAAANLVEAANWNNRDERAYRAASQIALKLLAAEIDKPSGQERNARIQNYIATSISLAKRATEIMPQESEDWTNLGFIYQNLILFVDGADRLSEEAYLRAAELRPGDPNLNYRIGLLYIAKLDLLAQLVNAKRITAAQANGTALDAVGKAEENLRKAVELSPNFGLAIYNLSIIYERQGKVNEAIKELEKVLPANSNQPGLAFELGLLYYRAGRKNDAFNALQRAVFLAPDYANARWYLALIYEERKDLDPAIEQLERILSAEVNKNNQLVISKLQDLRAGRTKIPPGNVLDQQPIQ